MKISPYVIILLIIGACNQSHDTWEIPQETHKCIITKHYQPVILDGGEVVCGTSSDYDWVNGRSRAKHGAPGSYSDTVYYDAYNNVLLIKDAEGYCQRKFYCDAKQNKLSKQITKFGKNYSTYECIRDSDLNIITVNHKVKGEGFSDEWQPYVEIYKRDNLGRLIETLKNENILTKIEYLPSTLDKEIKSYVRTNNEDKMDETILISDAKTDKLLYRKVTEYENIAQYKVFEYKYTYDEKWNCICLDFTAANNTEIQEIDRIIWKYNPNNDIISECTYLYANVKSRTVVIDGETMNEITHSGSESVFSKDVLTDMGRTLYEYKYNSRGEWIYRIAYRQKSKDVISVESSLNRLKQEDEALIDLSPYPIAITVRDIKYYD